MEVNEGSLNYVRKVLLESVSPNTTIRREAENNLRNLEEQKGFTIILLHLINHLSNSNLRDDIGIRQSASIIFKNVIKKRWEPDDDEIITIHINDKENIKEYIIDLMCSTPREVQIQLAEAVSIISKHDFPGKWNGLLPLLVQKLQTNDLHILHGIMLTANSIMKRFRNSYKSDELYEELLYCLNGFQEPLTAIFVSSSNLLEINSNNRENMNLIIEILRLIIRVFYSLNWQDIPEYFEDNMNIWMPEFAKYLTYDNPLLIDTNELYEPGSIEKLKTGIIENLILYATKYEEMFTPYLGRFTELIWQLLVTIKSEPKYDMLTTVAIKFLTTISSKQMNSHLFTDETLRQIIEQIIVPNLIATDNDEELFQDNPSDYIRKDIEGSDQDTRRRSACDLVRSLLKYFQEKTSNLCVSYINGLLSEYQKSGYTNWKLKDGALHLVLAVSILSTSISQGAGTLNPNVNILEIFNTHVLPELHDLNVSDRPIVKADAIKLICTFRSHFPKQFLLELLPHLTRYLSSESIVVQTYAALCIEKFMTVKEESGELRLGKDAILPILNPLFSSLFPVLENEDLPENDYVMKCIMRLLSVVGSDITNVTELVLNHLTISLERVCKNPANPHFNHYLFECIALLVKSSCSPNVIKNISNSIQQIEIFTKFELLLFPPFQSILQLDVIEFVPYVFQILAQLLSYRPIGTGLSEAYRSLFPPLLSPVLWLRKGNIPALTDLFLAYIYQGIDEIIATNLLEGVLGIFQKLLTSKSTETYAFKLICAIVQTIPTETLSNYISMIFQLILMRLQESNTPQLSSLFMLFLSHLSVSRHGALFGYNILNTIQNNLILMLISDIWEPNVNYMIENFSQNELNNLIIGGSELLTNTPLNNNLNIFAKLLQIILNLIGNTKVITSNEINLLNVLNDGEDMESREYDNTYSKLAYAQIIEFNNGISELNSSEMKLEFINRLSKLCNTNPGKYIQVMQNGLTPEQQQILSEIIQTTGIQIQ